MTPAFLPDPLLTHCRRIFLRGLCRLVRIGIHDFERAAPQRILFDIDLYVPLHQNTPRRDQIDEVVALWRDEAVAAARRQPGCTGGQLLIDRASGKGISHFTWETQAQANATGPESEHLKQILGRFAAYFVAPPIVEHWEVAAQG